VAPKKGSGKGRGKGGGKKPNDGWARPERLRNARGQYTSARDYKTVEVQEQGANRGNQRFLTDRYEVKGASLNMISLAHWLQQPWVYQVVQAQTDAWQQDANDSAITRNTYYGQIVYNNRPELGPVGVVFCDNYPSVIDDRKHGTLLKVAAKPNIASFNAMLAGRARAAESMSAADEWGDNDGGDDLYGSSDQAEYAW